MAQNNNVTDFLLTKHILTNSISLTTMYDFKEELIKNNRKLYQAIRQPLNKLIREQQAMHDIYKQIMKGTEFFQIYEQLESVVNNDIDKELLK